MKLDTKHIICLTIGIILMLGDAFCQQIELDRMVIGATHVEYDNAADFVLSGTVGEVYSPTKTTTDLIITAGFQQSNYILKDPLIVDLIIDSAACIGANDGAVSIGFVSNQLEQPYTYQWSTGASSEAIAGLAVGSYSVTVTGSNGLQVTNTAVVDAIDPIDCAPHFYTGITPNNDLDNDYWHVDNAEFFQNKVVKVFNRYGALVWESNGYDNFTSRFEGNHLNGNELPDGTYFFIAEFDNSTYKGWIEVSR